MNGSHHTRSFRGRGNATNAAFGSNNFQARGGPLGLTASLNALATSVFDAGSSQVHALLDTPQALDRLCHKTFVKRHAPHLFAPLLIYPLQQTNAQIALDKPPPHRDLGIAGYRALLLSL